jgi:hypothetical protein
MPADRRDLRHRLFALAAEQAGYFTAAQAKVIGYSYPAQAHHVGAGNWIRVDRGIFRLTDWVPEIHDELARWHLWSKQRAVVSHETALAVHGVGEFESPRLHLTVPRGFRMRDDAVTLHSADLPREDIDARPGFRLTTVTRISWRERWTRRSAEERSHAGNCAPAPRLSICWARCGSSARSASSTRRECHPDVRVSRTSG